MESVIIAWIRNHLVGKLLLQNSIVVIYTYTLVLQLISSKDNSGQASSDYPNPLDELTLLLGVSAK